MSYLFDSYFYLLVNVTCSFIYGYSFDYIHIWLHVPLTLGVGHWLLVTVCSKTSKERNAVCSGWRIYSNHRLSFLVTSVLSAALNSGQRFSRHEKPKTEDPKHFFFVVVIYWNKDELESGNKYLYGREKKVLCSHSLHKNCAWSFFLNDSSIYIIWIIKVINYQGWSHFFDRCLAQCCGGLEDISGLAVHFLLLDF